MALDRDLLDAVNRAGTTIVMATHTRDELQFALDVFKKVGAELGLI